MREKGKKDALQKQKVVRGGRCWIGIESPLSTLQSGLVRSSSDLISTIQLPVTELHALPLPCLHPSKGHLHGVLHVTFGLIHFVHKAEEPYYVHDDVEWCIKFPNSI
jgi:hypothetical protein